MKKILFVIALGLCLLTSCSKEGGNSIAGTNWGYSNDILQFTSKSNVSITNTQTNKSSSGTYSYKDNKVTFNLTQDTDAIDFIFDYGEVNGTMMNVTYHYTFGGKEVTQTRIYTKQ